MVDIASLQDGYLLHTSEVGKNLELFSRFKYSRSQLLQTTKILIARPLSGSLNCLC